MILLFPIIQLAALFMIFQGGRMIEWSNVAYRAGEPAAFYGLCGLGLTVLGFSIAMTITLVLTESARQAWDAN